MDIYDQIDEVYKKAQQWKDDGHKGEGPHGHALRDIRGHVNGRIEKLNSTIIEA